MNSLDSHIPNRLTNLENSWDRAIETKVDDIPRRSLHHLESCENSSYGKQTRGVERDSENQEGGKEVEQRLPHEDGEGDILKEGLEQSGSDNEEDIQAKETRDLVRNLYAFQNQQDQSEENPRGNGSSEASVEISDADESQEKKKKEDEEESSREASNEYTPKSRREGEEQKKNKKTMEASQSPGDFSSTEAPSHKQTILSPPEISKREDEYTQAEVKDDKEITWTARVLIRKQRRGKWIEKEEDSENLLSSLLVIPAAQPPSREIKSKLNLIRRAFFSFLI